MGLFNYPKIIKKPMDLKTLWENLDRDVYQSYEQFFADI